ncbi:hypothetical protein ElyMa_005009500 [Elysia marginata]|uniref:Uncharacterized protein n=1 Tax=Elysia marginata TaxID=1093978 RepID=A0AAV4J7D4_9GAST|nr:hypothetical protein ElyMa_005009500 [Elysia marginata]
MGSSANQLEFVVRDFSDALSCRWIPSTSPFACGWYAVVVLAAIPRRLFSWVYSEKRNYLPRSEVMSSGTPNCATQWWSSAVAQVKACASGRGTASGHLVNLSMMVTYALAFRKRSHQVHMETLEPIRWGQAFCERKSCMMMYFGSLTVLTFLTPLADVTPHAMQHEAFRNGILRGPNNRVTEAMDLVENWSSPKRRKYWPWNPYGNVAEKC